MPSTGGRSIDIAQVDRLDTLGAWVLDRTRHDLGAKGLSADFLNASAEHRILLDEVAYRGFQPETGVISFEARGFPR